MKTTDLDDFNTDKVIKLLKEPPPSNLMMVHVHDGYNHTVKFDINQKSKKTW